MSIKKIAAAMLAVTVIAGCASGPTRPPVADELVWSSSKDRPEWSFNEPVAEGTKLQFVGISNRHSTEKMSLEAAKINAMAKASDHLGVLVEREVKNTITSSAAASEINDEQVDTITKETIKSLSVMKGLQVKALYTELWSQEGERFYQTFVLVEIPKSTAITLVDSVKKRIQRELNPPQQRAAALVAQPVQAVQPVQPMQSYPIGMPTNLDSPIPVQ